MTNTINITMDNLEEVTALIFGEEEFKAMKERAARRTEAALEAFKNEIEEIMHEIDENNDIMSREEVEQVKVNTMINRFSAENKQQAQRFIGAIKNNASDKFKSDIVSVNMDELAQAIRQGKTIVPAVIDGKLIDANFKEQQLFMLDIDDAGCSLNEIKRRLREYPYSMIYTSFSHTIAMPKYRIAFIADRVITDAEYLAKMRSIMQDYAAGVSTVKYPEKLKGNVHAQAFYGVVSAILENEWEQTSDVKCVAENSVEYGGKPISTQTALLLRDDSTPYTVSGAQERQDMIADISIEITDIVERHSRVDWTNNKSIHDKIAQDIDDMFYEYECAGKCKFPFEVIDKVIENVKTTALRRFKG